MRPAGTGTPSAAPAPGGPRPPSPPADALDIDVDVELEVTPAAGTPAVARPAAAIPGSARPPTLAAAAPGGGSAAPPAAPVRAAVAPALAAGFRPMSQPAVPVASARRPHPPPPPPVPAAPAASTGGDGGLDAAQLIELEQRHAALDDLDYYELLRVDRNAAPAEIKKAFYRESRAFHPDRFFHMKSTELKDKVGDVYKRITEAYYVLRDDTKRRKYLADVTGPERAQKLRFNEASESETKQAAKKEQEEQIGSHPKGRQFFQTATADIAAERWAAAERNLKMAMTYEPSNARYKERLAEVQKKLTELAKQTGENFKIK